MPIYWSKIIGWAATIVCASLSARSAAVFAKHSPRVFTILALFALNWAILIPYYSEADQSELLAGFSGFLLVYVGVLVHREALNPIRSNEIPSPEFRVSGRPGLAPRLKSAFLADRIALKLLVLLIAPSALGLPLPQAAIPKSLSLPYTTPTATTIVTVLGYFMIWSALKTYSSSKKGILALLLVAIPYAFAEIAFLIYELWLLAKQTGPPSSSTGSDFWRVPPEPPMNDYFLLLFAILKLLFTGLFIYLLLKESFSNEDRQLTAGEKILKFIGVPVQPPIS